MPFMTQIPRGTTLHLKPLNMRNINGYSTVQLQNIANTLGYSMQFDVRIILPFLPLEGYPQFQGNYFCQYRGNYYAKLNGSWYIIESAQHGTYRIMEEFEFSYTTDDRIIQRPILGMIAGTPIYASNDSDTLRPSSEEEEIEEYNNSFNPYIEEPICDNISNEDLNRYPDVYVQNHNYTCKSPQPIVIGEWANKFNTIIEDTLHSMGL